jgi:hypothetical protein
VAFKGRYGVMRINGLADEKLKWILFLNHL